MSPLIDILILLDQRSVISRILFAEDFSDDSIREKIQEWQGIEMAKIPGAEWEFNQKPACGQLPGLSAMYEIGTLVLYDKRGVYRVENVGVPPVRGAASDYYELCAVFSNSNEIIYTPVDMTSSMRPLISGGEAAHYLELFGQLEPHVFRSGKPMDLTAHYRDLLASRKVEDCLLLIKEIYVKQREMARQKKSPRQVDAQYLRLAEKLICEEFAVVLNTTPDLIQERLHAVMRRRATA